MTPAYWCIWLDGREKVYVYDDKLPSTLRPDSSDPLPPMHTLMWLEDHSGGKVGFPVSAIRSIEWIDDTIREADKAFSVAVDGVPKEPWE